MKVFMTPDINGFNENNESGIRRVVEFYHKYGKKYGIEYVSHSDSYDIRATHAGMSGKECEVSHLHGMYFTADYEANRNEYQANANIIKSVKHAKVVTVPSDWVAEIFQRDMRFMPDVIPHGIEADKWKHDKPFEKYVLWNKNRTGADVCNVEHVYELAKRAPKIKFVSTYQTKKHLDNIEVTGILQHEKMKDVIQRAGIYLSTTKETFGIGVLEALASGVPVLGFRYGGNSMLVKHKVTGYLADPMDFDDLARGLEFCSSHRTELSKNCYEDIGFWTWDKAVEKLAKSYEKAMQPEVHDVSVIVPLYNYADILPRAIDSISKQSLQPKEIIIVDDGSTDNPKPVIDRIESPIKITYIRQENAGVAHARNRGVQHATTRYVCCLDADDQIHHDFLKVCVTELERNRDIDIAYTGLRWIKPDGTTGVSAWPSVFNFDEQLKRNNQLPTCCVYKKVMWERLGGYRQRYAPDGAGAEDAEFWLRAGAYGFNAKKVTDSPMFVYSWMSGRVSGSADYKECDWTGWHPWTLDGQHPFASVATPAKLSHPVRQYDEPVISVIIPVGTNHESDVINALDSLEAQTLRQWEAIVVWDSKNAIPELIRKSFPFVKFIELEKDSNGAGYARNRGVEQARSDLVLFLDADDWLYPKALEMMLNGFYETNSIIYTDYVGKSYVEKEELDKLKVKVLLHNEKTNETIAKHESLDYDCARAQIQPDIKNKKIYHWCLVTCLVPKAWHNEIGGFDESMESWEDVDYHWRMSHLGKCYARLAEPLMVYRFATGNRRELARPDTNKETAIKLLKYMKEKYEGVTMARCSSCGGSNRVTAYKTSPAADYQNLSKQSAISSDADYILVTYISGNKGEHSVIGGVTKIKYGYHGGGDEFLVHRADIASQPHLFSPKGNVDTRRQTRPGVQASKPIDTNDLVFAEESQPPESIIQKEVPKEKKLVRNLFDIPYTTDEVVVELRKQKITTVIDLTHANPEDLTHISGIGLKRAEAMIAKAKEFASE